jgi:uncharacterized membrane protein
VNIQNLLGAATTDFNAVIASIRDVLNPIFYGALILIGIVALVFAIYVGFRLARAEDESKRKEAKSQLLWSIIAVIVVIVVAVVIPTVIGSSFFTPSTDYTDMIAEAGGNVEVIAAVNGVLVAVANLVSALLELVSIGAIFFAIYLGIRLARAEDESKRKEAKKQLLWTLIALVGIILLTTVVDLIVSGTLRNMLNATV